MKDSHPRPLYLFFFADIWERFGFYSMRGILVLFMTQALLFSDAKAYEVFAAATALLYLTPVLGGQLADSLLGIKNALLLGAAILLMGYALLAIPDRITFYLALGCICVGIGFFIPNIASAVGTLYQQGDARRDSGFSILYAGTNIGAFIPPLMIGYLVQNAGWYAAFALAAISILILLFILVGGLRSHFQHTKKLTQHSFSGHSLKVKIMLFGGIIAAILLAAVLIRDYQVTNFVLIIVGIGFVTFAIKKCLQLEVTQRKGVIAALILTLVSVVFWALYQQAATSLTIFTEYNVNRHLNGWTIPTVMFQSLNPLFVIVCAPFLGRLWVWLGRYNLNPSVPAKFAFGILLMGAGFVLVQGAITDFSHHHQVASSWIIISYLLQTLGELLLSPIGMSMITEFSPASMGGLMMGLWYFATTIANILAGFIAEMTTVPSGSNAPAVTNPVFAQTFGLIGWSAIGISLLFLFVAVPSLSRMMRAALE